MALPTSRDVTFAPGAQVPSSVLNNLQDWVVESYADRTYKIKPVAMAFEGAFWTVSTGQASTTTDGVAAYLDLGSLLAPLLPNGDWRITALRAYVQDTDPASVLYLELRSAVLNANSTALVAGPQASDGSGTLQTLTVTGAPTFAFPANNTLLVYISTDGGGANLRRIYGVEIDVTFVPA